MCLVFYSHVVNACTSASSHYGGRTGRMLDP